MKQTCNSLFFWRSFPAEQQNFVMFAVNSWIVTLPGEGDDPRIQTKPYESTSQSSWTFGCNRRLYCGSPFDQRLHREITFSDGLLRGLDEVWRLTLTS
jgi:hypothetical protein